MMKRLKLFYILALLLMVGQQSWAQSSWAKSPIPLNTDDWYVWDGKSEERPGLERKDDGTYRIIINKADELAWVMKHFEADDKDENPLTDNNGEPLKCWEMDMVLNANCDMTAALWKSMGQDEEYQGHFYGNNHTIRIKIYGVTDNYQGLFAEIGEKGVVSDLHVDGNISCSDSRLVGGIAGENNGLIKNCWVSADVHSGWENKGWLVSANVGGIAGYNDDSGTIEYCCMSGHVSGYHHAIGLIMGSDFGGIVRHCTAYGRRTTHYKLTGYDYEDLLMGDDYRRGEHLYYWGEQEKSNFDAEHLASYLQSFSGNDVYRYALQYPFGVNFNATGPGRIVASPARARYKDRVDLKVEHGRVKEISCENTDVVIQGNEAEGYYVTLPMLSLDIKVVFDDNLVNLTANDGGDGYYWRSYYSYYNESLSYTADENTVVYQAAVNGGLVEQTEVPGRKIPAGEAVILRSTSPDITLTPAPNTNTRLEGNALEGGWDYSLKDPYVYVLSRGDDGKGPLGFYKTRSALYPDKAHLAIFPTRSASAPAMMSIKQR